MIGPLHAGRARGSAIAETAVTLSFTLLMIFGGLQLALAGYYQMQLDGATFEFAHAYALGITDPTGLGQVGQLFPNVPAANVTFSAASPPQTNVPVNFTQFGALNNRYGGASIIRPQRLQAQATLNVTGLSVFGNSLPFSSGNVEGRYMVSNHDDDAQGAAYDSQTVYDTQVNPFQGDDQNVPPYYFNFAFSWYCNDPSPWTDCHSKSLRSMGFAEYLKDGPDDVDGNYDNPQNGVAPNAQFQAMACHERIYAELLALFPAAVYPPDLPNYDPTAYDDKGGAVTLPYSGAASIPLVYSWDVMPIHGEGVGPGLGQTYPLHPLNGCQAGGPGA